jgi:hypothetical protein
MFDDALTYPDLLEFVDSLARLRMYASNVRTLLHVERSQNTRQVIKSMKMVSATTAGRRLFPNVSKLVWIDPELVNDATYFMHDGVDTFHVCLPDFPEVAYCPTLMSIPEKMPQLRCLRTFLLSPGTEELWEMELEWVQTRLPVLHKRHEMKVYRNLLSVVRSLNCQ